MLSQAEQAYVDSAFAIYDHNWRLYSAFLGEPFLIGDLLAYFDGQIFYLCAYSLENLSETLDGARIATAIKQFPMRESVEAIDVWGNTVNMPPAIETGPHTLDLVEHAVYADARDATLEMDEYQRASNRRARKAERFAVRKKIDTEESAESLNTADQLRLLRDFILTHDISPVHRRFYLSFAALLGRKGFVLFRTVAEQRLIGMSLVYQPNASLAVRVMGFYDSRYRHLRPSDVAMQQILDWSKSKGIARLHLGYSASPSLLAFKQKWGTLEYCPCFAETFYSRNEALTTAIAEGGFIWQDRVLSGR